MRPLPPHKMMSKALVKLTINDPFFGCLAMRMNMEAATPKFCAGYLKKNNKRFCIATNGERILYNPEFIAEKTLDEVTGLLAHEAMHVAMKHHIRRGNREIKKWNQACDLAINPQLLSSGYTLPDIMTGITNKIAMSFKDKSAEAIYTLLPTQDGGNDGDKKGGDPGGDGGGGSGSGDPDQDQDQEGDDDQDQDGDQGSGDDSSNGNGKDFENAPEDPGGVIDHPELDTRDQNKQRELEERTDQDVETAFAAAQNAGKMPGWMERIINKRRKVFTDYRELLRNWMEKNVFPGDYSWSKPNKRYLAHGIYLPGLSEEEDTPNIVFAIDCSGSVNNNDLALFESHINSVLEEFPCSYTAVYFDTEVTNVQHFEQDELPVKLKAVGGGGTNFAPVFQHLKDHRLYDAAAVIFFTDLCTSDYGQDPGVPVLWMNHYRGSDNTNVPFGAVIPIKTEAEMKSEYEEAA